MSRPADVAAYLEGLSEPVRAVVEQILTTAAEELPGSTESISYGIPTVSADGRRVVHVGGWARHVSLYPVPAGDAPLLAALQPYVAGKGTVKFPLSTPIPYDLIRRVIRSLVDQPR